MSPSNLFHDNLDQDLFVEVDHGPFLVDNNLFLSPQMLLMDSQGGAFAHNLVAGNTHVFPFDRRETPFHKAHSTELVGLHNNPSGDVRYYNNLFLGHADLSPYDEAKLPVWMAGNVFLKGAKPSKHEETAGVKPDFDPEIKLVEEADGYYLELKLDKTWATEQTRQLVSTSLLGKAAIPDLPFENADGSPFRINIDYFGNKRNEANPFPGPFELSTAGKQRIRVWPITN